MYSHPDLDSPGGYFYALIYERALMQVTLREKVKAVHDAGISTRHMELLLERSSMSRRDAEYVEKLWNIISKARQDDVTNRCEHAILEMSVQDGLLKDVPRHADRA